MTQLTRGRLATATGIHIETVRYYEQRGLLPEPPRQPSGYRVYPLESVERLHFIKGAQALGFTLDEIRELLTLRVDEHASSADVRRRAQEKLCDIEARIATLSRMRDALAHLVDQCDGAGPTGDCPILEALPHFSAGAEEQVKT